MTTLFFNAGSNVVHWLFAYKYWVISREIPKALRISNPSELKSSEKKYNVVNIIGLLINLLFCIWLAIRRGQLSYQSAF